MKLFDQINPQLEGNLEDDILPNMAEETPVVPADVVDTWLEAKKTFVQVQAEERAQRSAIVNTFFTQSEGARTVDVTDGRRIAGIVVLNRTVDPSLLVVYAEQIREAGISLDKLIKYTPSLVIGEYRDLTDEQKMVFDQILSITDGTPQLEVREPSKKKGGKKK